jgi:transposase
MGAARRKYTQEYKAEAVELVINSGRPVAEVARDLGINEGTLGNWVNKAKRDGVFNRARSRSLIVVNCDTG